MAKTTATRPPIIVLFEDNGDERKSRCKRIEAAVPRDVLVVPFEGADSVGNKKLAIEDRLFTHLRTQPQYNGGNIGLIVCDRALDCYDGFQVASETVVSSAARALGVPICLYERAGSAYGVTLKQRKPWEKGEIIIDGDGKSFGEECAALYCGFQKINGELARMPTSVFSKKTPAEILAFILNKPEETDRIALYGAGEQSFLEELLTFYDPKKRKKTEASRLKIQHYPRVMGNWLFSSILRFPGILVNEMAAGSLLNINPADLRAKPAVRKFFASAEYQGPFADDDCNWRWWWRRDLDAIINKAGVNSGLELVKRTMRSVRGCNCCEGDHPAGFVCMISDMPVCDKHSRGGISWFPGGSDLARVRTSEYNKIGPFLGLY